MLVFDLFETLKVLAVFLKSLVFVTDFFETLKVLAKFLSSLGLVIEFLETLAFVTDFFKTSVSDSEIYKFLEYVVCIINSLLGSERETT